MKSGVWFGALAGASWGLVFLAPALLPSFSPVLLTGGRFVAYGLLASLLALPLYPRLRKKWQWQDLPALLRLSLTSNILYFLLLAAAVQQIGIAATALIIGLLPLTITLLGRSEGNAPPLKRLLWPLVAVLAGVACINLNAVLGVGGSTHESWERLLGVLLALAALASWSWYAKDNATSLKRTSYGSNEWSLLVGICSGLLAGLLWGGLMLLWPAAVQTAATEDAWRLFWGLNLMLAVVSSWFGYLAWNACTRRLPLTLTGHMVVFETLFALLYGFIYLQRLPSLLETLAILLLLGGVMAAVRLHAQPLPHVTEAVGNRSGLSQR